MDIPAQLTNWAGNYTYSAARLHRPTTIEQLQELVAGLATFKVLGTRHSFNGIADTSADLISLEHFDQLVALDHERSTATVGAGVRYGQLCGALSRAGYALHNLASLPHISIAGACATATHGSGDEQGNLATAVLALELVTAGGELVALSREHDGEQFQGAVVALGGLGVVTTLKLQLVPAFEMRQHVYEQLPLAWLEKDVDTVMSTGYSVSLFTSWRSASFEQVWVKRRVEQGAAFDPEPRLFEARLAAEQRHPIAGLPAEHCTPQLGLPGPWHERLPHFRMGHTPSSGKELQSEYIVPRRHAFAALSAIAGLRQRIAPLLQISEVRSIAADQLWMSPCYRQDSVAIHFTWNKDWPAVSQLLPLIERELAPFGARPHWGKLFTMEPERLQSLYERLPDFRLLLRRYDPAGKLHNDFLRRYILEEA